MKPGLGRKLGLLVVFAIVCTQSIRAQEDEKRLPVANSPSQDQSPSSTPSDTTPDRELASGGLKQILVNVGQDQKQIWLSPARIRFSDAAWLVPFGGITASLFVTDRQYSASLSNSPFTIRRYNNVSNAGIAGLTGAAAGMYLISFPAHNEHWHETGWLAGEAMMRKKRIVVLVVAGLGSLLIGLALFAHYNFTHNFHILLTKASWQASDAQIAFQGAIGEAIFSGQGQEVVSDAELEGKNGLDAVLASVPADKKGLGLIEAYQKDPLKFKRYSEMLDTANDRPAVG